MAEPRRARRPPAGKVGRGSRLACHQNEQVAGLIPEASALPRIPGRRAAKDRALAQPSTTGAPLHAGRVAARRDAGEIGLRSSLSPARAATGAAPPRAVPAQASQEMNTACGFVEVIAPELPPILLLALRGALRASSTRCAGTLPLRAPARRSRDSNNGSGSRTAGRHRCRRRSGRLLLRPRACAC